ncbi:MAG: sensor domain-containing diguanylate cyclase [Desulfohalobiaceae bacterium]|nr:sensor domain-containing diguanylate cyclase [Desulfohalobiaceae bacterium]
MNTSGQTSLSSSMFDLVLDIVLEIMEAESGSIMLLDDQGQELTVKNFRGLKKEIVDKARVRMGSGVSGKVAQSGEPVCLQGHMIRSALDIQTSELVKTDLDRTSYIVPFKIKSGTIGTLNINTAGRTVAEPSKTALIQNVLKLFSDYLHQIELSESPHEPPSQLYTLNLFREYEALSRMRSLFDYVFHLLTDLLRCKKKGLFLLRNQNADYFDMILGYGFDAQNYREVYDALVPTVISSDVLETSEVRIFQRSELKSLSADYLEEQFVTTIPLVMHETPTSHLLLFTDTRPTWHGPTEGVLRTIARRAAQVIQESGNDLEIQELTYTDRMTNTYSYGRWWVRFQEEIKRAKRAEHKHLSIMTLDIDHFDALNRAHGYQIGDHLLYVIADRIKACVRAEDIVGRTGGDEFGVLLCDADHRETEIVAQRILKSIAGIPEEGLIQREPALTLSGGYCIFPEAGEQPEKLIKKAKTALVSAKILGGNRIKAYQEDEE